MKSAHWLTGIALAVAAQTALAAPQTVDIMVLYSKEATQLPNGRDIDARIASYIEFANTAYAKSGANMRLRLVHKQLLDWANYYDVTGSNLDKFTNDARVQSLREQYGADIVQLINRTTAGQGYGVCGIAWVGTGAKNSDQYYSSAKNMAYGLTGVDCSLSTFAHEAGHNMGLRHSYEQDQQEGYNNRHSGTHEWSRGYGVQGQFSTIMAYPQVFNARRHAPLFSTPRLTDAECSNQPCGVAERSDAVRALNSMAGQIATFRPSKVPDTGNPDGGTPPGNPKPELPWCSKPALSGLISNGELRTLDGWQSQFRQADLSLVNVALNCRDNAVLLDTRGFDLLSTPVSNLKAGTAYRLRAKVMLKNRESRENVRLALLQEDQDGRLSYSAGQSVSLSVTGNEFTRLEKNFNYQANSATRNQYVAIWSDSGSSLMADEIELVEVPSSQPPVQPPSPTQVSYDFEAGIGGWSGFHSSARASSFAKSGRGALEAYARKYDGSGASVSLLSFVQGGQRYRLNADLSIGRLSSVTATAYAYLYVEDSNGRGQYLPLGQRQTRGGSWSNLQQDVQLPAGSFRRVDLLILGTQRSQSLFVDNVQISKL